MSTSALRYLIQPWENLGRDEVAAIFRLRIEVFVIEQDCPYQDIDGLDALANHLMVLDGDQLVAYSRILPPGTSYHDAASIGRILTAKSHRSRGIGAKMIRLSIDHIREFLPGDLIRISAQAHLQEYYGRFGFDTFGEEYLEDGIPHIGMVRTTGE